MSSARHAIPLFTVTERRDYQYKQKRGSSGERASGFLPFESLFDRPGGPRLSAKPLAAARVSARGRVCYECNGNCDAEHR